MTSTKKTKTEIKTLPDTSNPTKFHIGKKFFDYDQIDHFFNDFDANKFWALTYTPNISPIDSIKGGVLSRRIPKGINDTFFVAKLEKAEFKKSIVDKSKFSKIDEIFAEKNLLFDSTTKCVPIFRDILIFRKSGKIVGIAKICFRCGQNEIFGTSANTNDFGQNGDYERLETILRQ
jgi:hypothetical protein